MKRHVSLLLAMSLLCGPIPALAVWEYSFEARVALTDAVVLACGAIDPVGTKATIEEFERTLSTEERSQLSLARNGAEYKTVLEAALKEAQQLIVGTPDAKYKACQPILQRQVRVERDA
jgi:hypothetical protein